MDCGLKPDHKIIKSFYEETESSIAQGHDNEGNLAGYFANILQHCVKKNPNREFRTQFEYIENKKRLVFDGAIFNKFNDTMLYGIWEAKDLKDKLEKEVDSKFKKGYPKDNILFQTPHRLMLFQNGELCFDKNIKDSPTNLIDGLGIFFNYSKPAYENWEKASEAFKEKVEGLGKGLIEHINQELQKNQIFIKAFEGFKTLCQQSINPSISNNLVMEMLAQHLLTERLFRNVFRNSEFVNRNIIAREIEKVISALISKSFNREHFLRDLDHYYETIETAAQTFKDFHRKQAFLNNIYERFFQGFAVKTADKHGIVYTPQPIVEFMINSVEHLLKQEFNLSLSSPNVHILDPFVGTGNFIVHILNKLNPLKIEQKYKNEIHCNEINLLPYYIASVNIEHAYFEKTNEYLPFEGICLVDTFETLDSTQIQLFNSENTERVKKQKNAPIFVIIGNPPYNAGQQNENDNNKNKPHKIVDDLVRENYAKTSKSTNKNALSDPYVKAFAWATKRLEKQDNGIVAFVSNNSFLESIAFDGMRKHLKENFSELYILDLGGNVRKNNGVQNVFNIKVGVSINFLIKNNKNQDNRIYYAHIGDHFSRREKLDQLIQINKILNINWEEVFSDLKQNWLTEGLHLEFDDFIAMGSKEGKADKNKTENIIFKNYGRGVATSRDAWAYNFNQKVLAENMQRTIDFYNLQVLKFKRKYCVPTLEHGNEKEKLSLSSSSVSDEIEKLPRSSSHAPAWELENFIDNFVSYDDKQISWSRDLKLDLKRNKFAEFEMFKIRHSLYRPFTKQYLFFDRIMNEEVYQFPQIFPNPETEKENLIICVAGIGDRKGFGCFVSNLILSLDFSFEKAQCFPFYIYDENGNNRQENISDWALETYQKHYNDLKITKRDIFYYVYGLLHAKNYREKYAQNLKKELPRIPFVKDFWFVSTIGKELADLHLNYENAQPFDLESEINEPVDWKVEKMRLSKDKKNLVYNQSITFLNIPEKVFEYKLGNRSALEWVIDQYRIKTDERSGIINDPNQIDNEIYIIDLIMKIITVSLKTVDLTEQLNAISSFE
jgi:predicted helicase